MARGHDRMCTASHASNAAIVDFTLRQCLDTVAPSNLALANPEVLRKIMGDRRRQFPLPGWHHWIEDVQSLS